MNRGRVVDVVVPAGIADPARPSGGNLYDRRVCAGLATAGWAVRTVEVPGDWPWPGPDARAALAGALDRAPEGSVVLVDGLVASPCPEVLVPAGRRLRTVVVMHMPVGAPGGAEVRDREGAVLRASAAVVATSGWTRRWLLDAYGLDPGRVHVARPGVDAAPVADRSAVGGRLLAVGAVAPGKGHDLLVRALARLADLSWRCTCVGSLTRSPEFVAALQSDIGDAGLDGRVALVGPRAGGDLDDLYSSHDVLVLASRAETYGMVVTEALARGLPVIAHEVGGVPEALGVDADGNPPGLLVPTGEIAALAAALRSWLTDADLRDRLRASALHRRSGLSGWPATTDRVARVLEAVAA